MARSVERGAQGVHSAYLLLLNQRASANVLVEGGTEVERVEAVRTLHDTSRISGAPFCATHGARDEDRLVSALNRWLGYEDGVPPLECAGGTLYVDEPGALSQLAQRLLVDHSERVDEGRATRRPISGPARLAAGGHRDLSDDVASGRLLPALHDILDKFHIRLDPPEGPSAPTTGTDGGRAPATPQR